MTANDHRESAYHHVQALTDILKNQPGSSQLSSLVEECESLARAIQAFHMEAIRFRMYNVDRLLSSGTVPVPPEAAGIFAAIRGDLEAAGFHTRSHQAPS